MVFNSITFLIFFLIFFQLYWLINNKCRLVYRNVWIILSSYLFYGWWDWRFLSLIILSSTVDYSLALLMSRTNEEKQRKMLLWMSIGTNLGLLACFKYFNFFIDSFSALLATFSISLPTISLQIILPVGISFYTFQTLSYTIDVYKKAMAPTKNVFAFFAFVSFFPQLVAGPIERASHLLKQFETKQFFDYQRSVNGLRLILWGLFKKVVIADNLGILVNAFFDLNATITGVSTLLGALFFAFQIYADFSGYSDMAIGLSKMLAIDLKKNFQTPYFSASFGEFWRRWHISLSTWFRDYLYIPLGGNRGKSHRVYFNIFITFLLSGLWHGAEVTFLIWGALHGLVLILEKSSAMKINKWLSIPIVFFLVTLFWIPFRAENVNHLLDLSKSLFFIPANAFDLLLPAITDFSSIKLWTLLFVLILFLKIEWQMGLLDFSEWIATKSKWMRWSFYYTLFLLFLLLGNFAVKPHFIYFQF